MIDSFRDSLRLFQTWGLEALLIRPRRGKPAANMAEGAISLPFFNDGSLSIGGSRCRIGRCPGASAPGRPFPSRSDRERTSAGWSGSVFFGAISLHG